MVFILIPLLIVAGFYLGPRNVSAVQIGTGQVCITVPSASTCPLAPPLITSPSGPPTAPQLRVAVFINASNALDGFDITVLANQSFIKPAGVSSTGTVLQGTLTTLVDCIGGKGTGCASTDNMNTIHYDVTANTITGAPITGLLFTAIFNVTGNAQNVPIGFQTGCSGTSVSGGTCVTIANGSTTSVPETVQGAKYANQQYFDFQPELTNTITIFQGGTNHFAIFLDVISVLSFSGTVNIAAQVFPPGPTAVPSPSNLSVTPANTNTTVVTVQVPPTVPPGSYSIRFNATSGSLPPNILIIGLVVPSPDFALSANPGTLIFNVSVSGSSIITISSLGNFSGTVNLSLSASPGLTASLSTTSVSINDTVSGSTTLTVNATFASTTTVSGLNVPTFVANVTGTSGSFVHTISILVAPTDFSMNVSPGTVPVPVGTTAIVSVIVESQSATGATYTPTVSIKTFVNQITSNGPFGPSGGVSVTCNPTNVIASSQGAPTNCQVVGNALGNYTVTAVGTSGRIAHSVTFPVIVQGPDFTITANPTIQTVPVGKSSSVNIVFSRVLRLNDTVLASAKFSGYVNGTGPFQSLAISILSSNLNAGAPNATTIVTITAKSSTPTGTYTLQVIGAAHSLTHTATISIVVVTTTSPHDLAVTTVTASTTSTTVGSSVSITIQVVNLGKFTENSTVVAIVNELSVAEQNITIAPGQNLNITLTWNTSQSSPGAYTIGGKVLGVPGETNLDNNLVTSGTAVTLTAPTSVLSSSYLLPAIVIALVIVIGVVGFLFFQARRKIPAQ